MRFTSLAKGISKEEKDSIREELQAYLGAYPEKHWRRSGRLARWGLPRSIIMGLRNGKRSLETIFRPWVTGRGIEDK
jgi:hypothetical protein